MNKKKWILFALEMILGTARAILSAIEIYCILVLIYTRDSELLNLLSLISLGILMTIIGREIIWRIRNGTI